MAICQGPSGQMYRITIQGKPAPQPNSKTVWRRVYRWGSHWGYLTLGATPAENVWTVEKRTFLGSHTDEKGYVIQLESVKQCELSPPPTVDDVWEEEVVPQGAITHGTHWSIVGTREDLEKFVPVALKNALIRS
jgi:hypothetical protein